MINSPCAKCPRRNLPKDDCVKACQSIQELQGAQIGNTDLSVLSRIDCQEETRVVINRRDFGS